MQVLPVDKCHELFNEVIEMHTIPATVVHPPKLAPLRVGDGELWDDTVELHEDAVEGWPIVWVFFPACLDEPLEMWRCVFWNRRSVILHADPFKYLFPCLYVIKWEFSRHQLPQNHPKAVHIDLLIEKITSHHLGCHVDECSFPQEHRVCVATVLQLLAQPKVRQGHISKAVKQNIAGFEIPVDDLGIAAVQPIHGACGRPHNREEVYQVVFALGVENQLLQTRVHELSHNHQFARLQTHPNEQDCVRVPHFAQDLNL
mmetsp:Transcript_30239/g.76060  ORF Transcript_30239/g.76060 Transcript_30239/m.76060 type:complete len:258 (-) Transcript_30239:349-1122(-)